MEAKMKNAAGFGKAFLLGSIISAAGMGILAFFVWMTPLPERWGIWFGTGSLSMGCLITGFLCGKNSGKRGILYGGISAALLSAFLLSGATVLAETSFSDSLLHISRLPGVACGCIGGIAGVNRTNRS